MIHVNVLMMSRYERKLNLMAIAFGALLWGPVFAILSIVFLSVDNIMLIFAIGMVGSICGILAGKHSPNKMLWGTFMGGGFVALIKLFDVLF